MEKTEVFKKSKWIWLSNGEMSDQYGEFFDEFEACETEGAQIYISVDSDYALFVNDIFVASNQYGDYEYYKIYDTIDLSQYIVSGKNRIKIIAYHCGDTTFRYCCAKAGLIYEVRVGSKIVAVSGEATLSYQSPNYLSGERVLVSSQLGYTVFYDSTVIPRIAPMESVVVEKDAVLHPRPIKKHKMLAPLEMKSVTSHSRCHYLVDLGREVVGLPTLRIKSSSRQDITFSWGEHIADGGVRKEVGHRHFYFMYTAHEGKNTFTEYMLRIGCRYIEIFAENPIELELASVIPQVYETETRKIQISDPLDRKIYDVSVNTLKLCMMEHYVDCPWREQSFYAFDSRNQMLFGYYAFRDLNQAYVRANLKLMGAEKRADRLLTICSPSDSAMAIPSFSLYYILAVKEYIEYTNDETLAQELYEKLCSIISAFVDNMKDGMVCVFKTEGAWNFYDWSPHSDGNRKMSDLYETDAAITCLAVIALDALEYICNRIGQHFAYTELASCIRTKIREVFMCDNGLFTMHRDTDQFTTLANALAILAAVPDSNEAEVICRNIVEGKTTDCSLSVKALVYEALLNTDQKNFAPFILAEIRKNYGYMLSCGADTFWETIKGESDFYNAGSLCHGWSAVPIYVYHKLGIARTEEWN